MIDPDTAELPVKCRTPWFLSVLREPLPFFTTPPATMSNDDLLRAGQLICTSIEDGNPATPLGGFLDGEAKLRQEFPTLPTLAMDSIEKAALDVLCPQFRAELR
jgi:hypothetical protein